MSKYCFAKLKENNAHVNAKEANKSKLWRKEGGTGRGEASRGFFGVKLKDNYSLSAPLHSTPRES